MKKKINTEWGAGGERERERGLWLSYRAAIRRRNPADRRGPTDSDADPRVSAEATDRALQAAAALHALLQKPRESAEDVTQDEYASVEIEELAELLMAIRERRRFAPLQRIRSGLTRLKQAFPKAGFLAAVLPVRWRGRMVASLQYAGALSLIAFACLVGYVAGRDTGRVMFLAKFETPGDAGETSLLLEDGDNL